MACVAVAANSTTVHPKFVWQKCTKAGCTKVNAFLVHDKKIGQTWGYCPNQLDYEANVGVVTSTDGLKLSQRLVSTYKDIKPIGSRLYIMTEDEKQYEKFNFVGKEFTYTVDMSEIPCGVNAALYTSEMPKNGKGANGPPCGTGYCDANCVDGDCCPEFDIQEASSKAMVFTAHSCQAATGQGCDAAGCGYNPYRDSGLRTFWAVGGTVDVSKPITVVTQFIGSGSVVTEVKRKYVQGGKVVNSPGSLTNAFCKWQPTNWQSLNGVGASFARGHVVVFSLWDSNGMGWMDGGNAGPCTRYDVATLEKTSPNLKVTWWDVKFGEMESTY